MALLAEIKDPRVENVTVTRVEVSGDMRTAKVYVTVRGGDAKEALALRGLTSACGFLQKKCAARIDTRYTPRLQFLVDEGMKNLVEVSRILAEEKNANSQPASEEPDPDSAPDSESGESEGESESGESESESNVAR